MGAGYTLKKILSEKGITIKQLAEETGISVNSLYSITRRDTERIDSVNAEKIASFLDCPIWMFGGSAFELATVDNGISVTVHFSDKVKNYTYIDKLDLIKRIISNNPDDVSIRIDDLYRIISSMVPSAETEFLSMIIPESERSEQDGEKGE